MNTHPKKYLEVGNEVEWEDPDAGIGSGIYRIMEIVTESGLVEADDSVLVLSDGDGHCTEVFVSELINP